MKKAVLLALLLGGCSVMGPSREQLAQADDAACQAYGAQPGSDVYIQCRMQRDNIRQQGRDLKRAAILASPN